jgi:hypothetical protein
MPPSACVCALLSTVVRCWLLAAGYAQEDQEIDGALVEDVRSFVEGIGQDLAARDIARAREMGVPSYNAARTALGLTAVTSFAGITSDTQKAAALQAVYGSVGLVDAWVGGLCEDPLNSLTPLGTPCLWALLCLCALTRC